MKNAGRHKILVRYGLIIAFMLLLAISIVWALIDNTIVSAEAWNERAQEELSKVDTIMPERGDILAADGSILATNMQLRKICMDYRIVKFDEKKFLSAIDSIADSMAFHFSWRDAEQWKEYLTAPLRKPKDKRPRCLPLIPRGNYYDWELILSFPYFNRRNRLVTGLYSDDMLTRCNPYGQMARRSIGKVGQTKDDRTRRGKSGLERALDSLLRGKPGLAPHVAIVQQGAAANMTRPAERGYDITTTIDIKMQDIVEHELNKMLEHTQADWGYTVLMDVATGDIKAISNLELNAKTGKYIEGMNRAVLRYEPGSVVKVLSMLLALENGLISDLNEQIPTGAIWSYHQRNGGIKDSHVSASKDIRQIIVESSNIGMAKIITRAWENDPGKYYSAVKRIGFLDPFNVGIAGECTPRIDSIASNNSAGKLALSRMAFGYSTMIPGLYTLALYNAIANDGRFVRPRLVKSISKAGRDSTFAVTYVRDSICSKRNAAILRDMLHGVVHTQGGTGYWMLRNSKVELAGKTGTCNERDSTGHYIPGCSRLAFCGFFPYDKPLYSCITVIYRPRRNAFGAASTSGTVMRNIAESFFARGMLNNHSDFRDGGRVNPTDLSKAPVFYASADPEHGQKLRSALKSENRLRTVRQPSQPSGGIPNVVGYGVREAVRTLEKAGYNVRFSGSGCVVAQQPAAGNKAPRGSTVNLTMRN